MESRQLKYFVAVYEQRNLSRAADLANVAQSALSHHISNLEAEFGTPLFVRKARGMAPTAAGERLYEHARGILRSLSAAERDLRQGGAEISGDISIGMANSGVKAIGVPLMRTILTDYPRVKLTLTESLSGTTLMSLLSADLDLALVYNPPADSQLIAEPVLEEKVYCIGRPEVIGKSKKPLTFDEFSRLPVVLLRQGITSRALLDDPVLLKRLEAGALFQLNSITAIAGALLEGFGCAAATKLFLQQHLKSGALHARDVVDPELRRTLYICTLAGRPATYLMEAMKSLILKLVAEAVARKVWEARFLAGP
ncbi:MAG: LysR family transcriptional regulator [Hyphomicrobiales bacterium]|nr:LysR family transcriptional regulator [Hyphomicrobiales bacterium]